MLPNGFYSFSFWQAQTNNGSHEENFTLLNIQSVQTIKRVAGWALLVFILSATCKDQPATGIVEGHHPPKLQKE